jgi:hypothetical protein
MFADGVPLPFKVLASLPALMYGAMIFLAEGMPRSWVVITCAVFIGLFVVLAFLEYPLSATWPAFVGGFLLVMCALAFARGLPGESPLPLTQSDLEIWGVAALACLYLAWGGIAGRRAAAYM